ncbi:phage major capsid protein [Streptomyces sp. NPDC049577]|uniref:SU10 major capsid protein n=1 Tax=Streptomyces sp. NPDC049577 TaxID=3155153 RepID=UPI0034465FEC
MATQAELREALTAAGAAPLVPTIIDPMLLEYQRRYAPLVRAIPTRKWDSTVYYFNQRTARAQGGFVADGGARPVTNSTYVQNSFPIRNLQSVGAVTGYSQAVTRQLIGDLRAQEIEGSIQGLYWDIENAILWGNSGSTQYGGYPQFDGLDSLVSTFSGSNQNAIDFNAAMTLGALDKLIDMVEQQAAMAVQDASWMFVMSPTAASKVAQLLTAQQRFVDRVEVASGLNVLTYRDVPIVKTSFLSARSFGMGTVTTATATSGGSLPAATYYYQVVPVIARQGEVLPSTEVSQVTTGSTSTVTLSFSTPTGLDGSQPNLYKVYRSTSTGTETLLGYVDATVGIAADGVTPILTTSIVDDGVKLTPKNGSTVPAAGPAAYVGTNASVKPLATGQENIYLMARNQDFVVRPYVRELTPLDVYPTTAGPDQLPYAIVSDTTLAVRAPKYLGRLSRVTTTLSS